MDVLQPGPDQEYSPGLARGWIPNHHAKTSGVNSTVLLERAYVVVCFYRLCAHTLLFE